MRDEALPQASTNPEAKTLIFTLVSHTYTLSHTHPGLSGRFFKEFLVSGVEELQRQMPPLLHKMAVQLEANVPVAPAALLRSEGAGNVSQGAYLAFMNPEHLHVAEKVLAECTPKFAKFQAEAVAAVADIAENPMWDMYAGSSETYADAHVHQLPTLETVMVAALCIVSTFVFLHLEKHRADLFPQANDDDTDADDGSEVSEDDGDGEGTVTAANGGADNVSEDASEVEGDAVGVSGVDTGLLTGTAVTTADESGAPQQQQVPRGMITWPPLKTMLRMLAKLKDDYAGLDCPWAALLDTVRFSLVSKTLQDHATFVASKTARQCDLPECAGEDQWCSIVVPTAHHGFGRWVDGTFAGVVMLTCAQS